MSLTQKVAVTVYSSVCSKPWNEMRKWARKAALLLLATVYFPHIVNAQVVGGGFTNAGVTGQYYNNTSWSGAAAFTRNDVRLDFGTNNVVPPGGSSTPAYSSVAATNWSASWTGTFIPRFSEIYTFRYFTSGKLSVSINGGTPFINQTSATSSPVSVAYSAAFTAGTAYTITVKYSHASGPWGMFLHWSSASTPEEAIEPLSMAMGEPDTYENVVYADQFSTGRNIWAVPGPGDSYSSTLATQDANGWPMSDAINVVWEGQANKQGTYELQFLGHAQVTAFFAIGTFSVGSTNYGSTLSGTAPYDPVSGEGYNPSTNITQAKLTIPSDFSILYLSFQNTKRLPTDSPGTGVTNVKLMKPVTVGASTSFPFGTLFTTSYKNACNTFTTLRWLTANFNTEVNFSNTTSPTYFKSFVSYNECWEREIELSNETGKDLYITMPTNASSAYLTSVVNLLHYGADSTYTPYTSAQASPYYPPLNPNLAVYVEWSNEVPWNTAFTNPSYLGNMATADAQANNAEWQIINYDGASTGYTGGTLNNPFTMECRLQALRVQQASVAFRAGFGDAAMGTHVRIVLEDQYGNPYGMPQFLDHYFNKTDPRSTYTGTPHPVSYYVWGGGGATYYGGNNAQGTQSSTVVANGSFEATSLSAGTTSTSVSSWTASSTTGIYKAAVRISALSAPPTLGTAGNTAAANTSYGYKFTVGAHDIGVYQLARWNSSGNTGGHTISIFDTSGNQIATGSVNATRGTVGTFQYVKINAVRLLANTTYYLVSSETNGGDTFYGNTTGITSTSDLTVVAPATALSGSPWTFTTGTAGSNTYGPVDMQYTTNLSSIGFPPDPPDGGNAAYLSSTGTITQTVNFAAAGTYALSFYVAWGKPTYDASNAADPLRFFIDGVEVTPNPIPDFYTKFGAPYVVSGFGVNSQAFNFETSIATTLTAGNHTITIEGTGTSIQFAYIDEIAIGSVDAIYSGGVPQTSYVASLNNEANWPKAFGIHRVAYEGGWALSASPQTGSGDSNSLLSHWAQWSDPRGATTSVNILNMYAQSGGDVDSFGSYETWPLYDTDNAATYPIIQGIVTANNSLRAEPTNGTTVPAVLTSPFISYGDQNSGTTINATDGFISWNIITPASGNYTFNLTSTGTSVMLVDGATTVAQGGSLFLTKGIHSAKVQSTNGSVAVTNLAVTQPSGPSAPTLSSTTGGSGTATVNWGAVTGATGYLVKWGTSSGAYTSSVDVGSATSYTITGLTNNTSYYAVVVAYNSGGNSLPSAEDGFIALTDGSLGTLATWNFTGDTGGEVSKAASATTPRLTVGALSRGSGYNPGPAILSTNRFGNVPVGNVYATTMAGAITANEYDQFTITANAGAQFSLNTLSLKPYFQSYNSNCLTGVTYSTDGVNFTTATVSGTGSETTYTVNFTGVPGLQGVYGATTVTIRIYMYGLYNYNVSALDNLSVTGTLATVLPPTITTQPQSQMISTGSPVTFSVTATSSPAATYQWKKNGTNITGATSSNYTISSVASGDAATYAVVLTNSVGSTTSANAVLDVLPADAQTASNLTGTPAALGGLNIGTNSGGNSSVRASGNWWINGSGGGGVNGSSDSFHFEQNSVTGDFQMYVQLDNLYDYGGTLSRAGLMVRDGTSSGSNFVVLAGTSSSSGGYKLISRTTPNSSSSETTTSGTNMTYTYPAAWMMIARVGTAIHAYVSSDNVNFYEVTPSGGITWTGISRTLDIGVFSSSGITGSNALAIMSNFEILQASTTNGPLLTWDFTAMGAPASTDGSETSATDTTTSIGMQSSTITRGAGSAAGALQEYTGRGAFNCQQWYATTLSAAKTAGNYFQFSVAPTAGGTMSLSSLQLETYQQNSHSTSTMVVEYSLDGFATEDGVSVGTINPINNIWTGASSTLTLSSVTALQNVTGTITFRIWGYGFGSYEDKGLGQVSGNDPDVTVSGIVH